MVNSKNILLSILNNSSALLISEIIQSNVNKLFMFKIFQHSLG